MKPGDLPLSTFEAREGDELIMKLGLGLTVFFARPFEQHHETIWGLWQKYLALAGKDRFSWARLGGGNKSRDVNASVYKSIEAWLTGKKSYGKTCYISIHDGEMDCMGDFGFDLFGYGEGDEEDEVGYLELSLPLTFLEGAQGKKLASNLTDLVADVDFLCGTAGFVFQRSPYKYNATIGHMISLGTRFEGVEITAGEKENYWAGKGLVSVNWITLAGKNIVEKAGGMPAFKKLIPNTTKLIPLTHGVALQTGATPLLGDMHRNKNELDDWRTLYRAIKPLQFIDTDYEFDPFVCDGQRTAKWLERLQ
jgi:hypothetical protein